MKILDMSDIHGDLDALKTVADFAASNKDKGLELVICNGDLPGKCLGREEAEQAYAAFGFLYNIMKQNDLDDFDDFMEKIKSVSNLPEQIKAAVRDYKELVGKYKELVGKQYEEIAGIFRQLPQKVLIVPGNWDSKNFFENDDIRRFGLHGQFDSIGEGADKLIIAGYGDAEDNTTNPNVPQSEIIQASGRDLYGFLSKEKRDIAVTHVPAFGFLDRIKNKNIGSPYVLAYLLRDSAPDLHFCGHCHPDRGAMVIPETEAISINPGNLGKYPGDEVSGSFVVVDYEKTNGGADRRIAITPYMINGNGKVCADPQSERYVLENSSVVQA